MNSIHLMTCFHQCARRQKCKHNSNHTLFNKPVGVATLNTGIDMQSFLISECSIPSLCTTTPFPSFTVNLHIACMKPGLIIVQLKVFSNICQSAVLSVKAFFRDRRTLSMKMMKLGMRNVPLGKTSWETWCLNYQGQRHYLRTIQIITLGPL
jgi:hypothetical protein